MRFQTREASGPIRRSGLLLAIAGLCWTGVPLIAAAESQVLLPLPEILEDVIATTFDREGHAIGVSSFEVEKLDPGLRRMKVEMAVDGGGINRSEATLATVIEAAEPTVKPSASRVERAWLRLQEERSQATRADGSSLDLLIIDHVAGRASCYPADDEELTRGKHVDLPADERVVNVPMQLLFQPLVTGEVDDVRFQITLCRNGPVLHDMIAVRGPRFERDGRSLIEIRYGPDLGRTVAWFASRLLPSFSFWFDAESGEYVAHRMPLHTKGPEVLLVRKGLGPLDLGLH
jgi:hypothetical protein